MFIQFDALDALEARGRFSKLNDVRDACELTGQAIFLVLAV